MMNNFYEKRFVMSLCSLIIFGFITNIFVSIGTIIGGLITEGQSDSVSSIIFLVLNVTLFSVGLCECIQYHEADKNEPK